MGKKDRRHKSHKRSRRDSDSDSDGRGSGKRPRTEKLVKKVTRHLKKHKTNVPGYSNEDNMFNDPNLTEGFVWKKKIEKQINEGVPLSNLSAKVERIRHNERLKEIDKVKKAREEREAELARQQEELSLVERARYAAEATEAAAKEEEFLFQQAMMSCRMRVRSGRMEPIDFVARNLDPELAMAANLANEPPYLILNRLNLEEMEKLMDNIKQFKEMDQHDSVHEEFWAAMHEVATHELTVATQQDMMDRAKLKGEVHEGALKAEELHVESEVQSMMAGKSYSELCDLEQELLKMVEGGEGGDPEYWEHVLSHLKVHKARAKLRSLQQTLIEQHMTKLAEMVKSQQEEEVKEADEAEPHIIPGTSAATNEDLETMEAEAQDPVASRWGAYVASTSTAAPDAGEQLVFADDGRYSPEPVDPGSIMGEEVVPEEEDRKILRMLREQVRLMYSDHFRQAAEAAAAAASQMSASDSAYQAMILDPSRHPSGVHPMLRHITEAAPHGDDPLAFRSGIAPPVEDEDPAMQRLRAEAMRRMGEDRGDQPFGGEVRLESRVYWWHEKYRPRKPKYFNRVHTGYEWNKYNQTHYDHDNPPPKVVQGYKFNIFYPDLMDKSLAPTYTLEKDTQSKDGSTCLLRFKAGPPYEDIAFRIVNKDWEYSHKKGFKCTFERGILHLYFNFKRQRYRR
ncbi:unnamed protein product [Ostreobium quekettii]|uniref:Splicing factor Cactin n=1 Tax=Ostreobium quekettii TaxID=121088 RepID=A0A8S1J9G6_9CHLO|nr:unnamed protein product [Ostreobium quekettii]